MRVIHVGTDSRDGARAFEIRQRGRRRFVLIRVRGGGGMEHARTVKSAKVLANKLNPFIFWSRENGTME